MTSPLLPAALKTVAVFSGITKKDIALKQANRFYNKGTTVFAPFNDPSLYLLVERQLAHILFESDALARDRFVQALTSQLQRSLTNQGFPDSYLEDLFKVIASIANILESHRVENLWGDIYPGSYFLLRRRLTEQSAHLLERAHDSVSDFLMCLEAQHKIPPGRLDTYRPILEAALKGVEHRDFTATLVMTRWAVARMVDLLLQEGGCRAAPDGQPANSGSKTRERLIALRSTTDVFGKIDPLLAAHYDDTEPSRSTSSSATKKASIALDVDLNDDVEIENVLARSQQQMTEVVEALQRQLSESTPYDKWLYRDTTCQIEFIDVRPEDTIIDPDSVISPEDAEAAAHLRSTFSRVLGRRNATLDSTGTEVDLSAAIERKLSGNPIPIFKSPSLTRGFKATILIDRSKSMEGARTDQVERAARIMTRALDFPFVELAIWGFQSSVPGEVTLTRFSPLVESFKSDKALVLGGTPIHIAVKVAANDLSTAAGDVKQLFLLTDGGPMFRQKGGRLTPHSQLRVLVRNEVFNARSRGIHVTTLCVGERREDGKIHFDEADEELMFMFGSPRYWRKVDQLTLGADLVKAVSTSFVNYLQSS